MAPTRMGSILSNGNACTREELKAAARHIRSDPGLIAGLCARLARAPRAGTVSAYLGEIIARIDDLPDSITAPLSQVDEIREW